MEQTLKGGKSTSVLILLSFSAAARPPFLMWNNLFSTTVIDTGSAMMPLILLTKFLFSKMYGPCCVDNKRYFGSENSRFNFTVSLNFHFYLNSSFDN